MAVLLMEPLGGIAPVRYLIERRAGRTTLLVVGPRSFDHRVIMPPMGAQATTSLACARYRPTGRMISVYCHDNVFTRTTNVFGGLMTAGWLLREDE